MSDESARISVMMGNHGNDDTQLMSVVCSNDDNKPSADDDEDDDDDDDDDDANDGEIQRAKYQFLCQSRLIQLPHTSTQQSALNSTDDTTLQF